MIFEVRMGHQIVNVIVENRRLSSYRRGSSSVSFIARVNDGAAFRRSRNSRHNRAHMSEICIWCYSIYDNDYVSATPTDGDRMIISSFAMKTINELLSVYRRARSRSSESGILSLFLFVSTRRLNFSTCTCQLSAFLIDIIINELATKYL